MKDFPKVWNIGEPTFLIIYRVEGFTLSNLIKGWQKGINWQ